MPFLVAINKLRNKVHLKLKGLPINEHEFDCRKYLLHNLRVDLLYQLSGKFKPCET